MNIDWDSKVLGSLNPVIENLQTINLNLDQIMNVADWIAYEDFPPPEQNISKNNPHAFLQKELLLRKEKKLPPFYRLISLIISGKNDSEVLLRIAIPVPRFR